MIAVDTNILVRIIVQDDIILADKAAILLNDNKFYISLSVLLELYWVLKSRYQYPKNQLLISYRILGNLQNCSFETEQYIHKLLELYEKGMDFEDAIHLISSENYPKLYSFDVDFVKKANKLSTNPSLHLA